MNLTVKKFILISNIGKHWVTHISPPLLSHEGVKLFSELRDLHPYVGYLLMGWVNKKF